MRKSDLPVPLTSGASSLRASSLHTQQDNKFMQSHIPLDRPVHRAAHATPIYTTLTHLLDTSASLTLLTNTMSVHRGTLVDTPALGELRVRLDHVIGTLVVLHLYSSLFPSKPSAFLLPLIQSRCLSCHTSYFALGYLVSHWPSSVLSPMPGLICRNQLPRLHHLPHARPRLPSPPPSRRHPPPTPLLPPPDLRRPPPPCPAIPQRRHGPRPPPHAVAQHLHLSC